MLKGLTPPWLRRKPRIFYGWWIVVAGILVDSVKQGTFNRGFTLYVLPIRNELGIGVAAISMIDMIGRLVGGIQGPVVGYLTDRVGVRALLIFGGVISGLGFILLAFTNSFMYLLLVFVGFLSIGFRSGYNNAVIVSINQWFRRNRSLAMSLVSAGHGLGGVVLAPAVGFLVFTFGWRPAAFISGVVIILLTLPLAFIIKSPPANLDGTSEMGRHSVGRHGRHGHGGRGDTDADFTAREAMRTPSYWLLIVAVGFRNMVHSGTAFLLAPLVVWFLQGTGRTETESLAVAAAFIGLMSLAVLVSNPIVGWLGDRWSKTRISALCMLGGVFSILALMTQSGQLWMLALFVILMAFSESANPLAWAILGDFFGRRSYGTLRGWQHLPDQLMSMATPVWMGWIYDNTGSYYWACVPLASLYAAATVVYWFLPRPKLPARLRQPQPDPAPVA